MPRIKYTKKGSRLYFPYQRRYIHGNHQNDIYNNIHSSENCNTDFQGDAPDNCTRTNNSESGSIFKSTQNNCTSFQPCLNSETDFKQTHDCFKNLEDSAVVSTTSNIGNKNCLNNTSELCDNVFDSSKDENTSIDSQLDESTSDTHLVKNSSIKDEFCDIDSDLKEAENCHKNPLIGSELRIKREPCDMNFDSDPSTSESTKEIKSCSDSSEHSNGICRCKADYSTSSEMMVEVKSEKPDTENSADSSPNQDQKRTRRNSKRKKDAEDHCPVCGLTIRCSDLENHFAKEIENLDNIAKNVRKNRLPYKQREGFKCGVNLGYVRAKCNRENRIAAKKAKYLKRHEVFCPVCKIRISGTDEEINEHVLGCFGDDDDSDINVTDYDENFEEYEIGNETRIRAISLVPGGHSTLHGYSSNSKSAAAATADDDTDLNVDVEDTQAFGKPQYTELDVIHNTSGPSKMGKENQNEEQLRRAVVSDPKAKPHVIEGNKWSQNYEIQNEIDEIIGSNSKNHPKEIKSEPKEDKGESSKSKTQEQEKIKGSNKEENSQNTESHIISTLKERIKDLEQQKAVKCLICLEPYTRPVVSTTCWHVHCEECWLVSMGVKKLCPQCNMIVCPTDLRRIYL